MNDKNSNRNEPVHKKRTAADVGRAGASPPAPTAGNMGESVTPHDEITSRGPGDYCYRANNIDTLDLGYYVNWSSVWKDLFDRLIVAKDSAKHSDGKIWKHRDAGEFLVLPSGKASGYLFHLKKPHCHIYLAAREEPGGTPNVYLSPSALALWSLGPREVVRQLNVLINNLGGTVERVQVSRCDLALDIWIDGGLKYEFLQATRISKSRKIATHAEDDQLQTYCVGRGGGGVQARIYNKFKQVIKTDNCWIFQVWGREYPRDEIWRVEFQLRREFLQKMGIETIDDLLFRAGALWKHLTTKWLSFRLKDDSNTTRRTMHPWWQYIQQCADQFGPDVDLQRRIKDDRLAALEWYISHIAGCLASYAAIKGCPTVDGALVKLANEVEDYWLSPERDWDEEYKKRCLRADIEIQEVDDDDIPI